MDSWRPTAPPLPWPPEVHCAFPWPHRQVGSARPPARSPWHSARHRSQCCRWASAPARRRRGARRTASPRALLVPAPMQLRRPPVDTRGTRRHRRCRQPSRTRKAWNKSALAAPRAAVLRPHGMQAARPLLCHRKRVGHSMSPPAPRKRTKPRRRARRASRPDGRGRRVSRCGGRSAAFRPRRSPTRTARPRFCLASAARRRRSSNRPRPPTRAHRRSRPSSLRAPWSRAARGPRRRPSRRATNPESPAPRPSPRRPRSCRRRCPRWPPPPRR
mmetsp:Transcript_107589/g.310906  ORF Transcript_107589/g.310906 Transcript_107589/m.310906 type:complete len:273 (+) Transcript_107589:509-1327(+)